MEFVFSDEQDMLRASARELMADRYPIERVTSIADGGGFDRGEWAAVSELGWTGISVPEADGGAGLSFLEELVVAEELGRALYPGPFFASVILALPLLRAAGADDQVKSLVAGERIATVAWAGPDGRFGAEPADGSFERGRLSAERRFVPSLAAAGLVAVVGSGPSGPAVWLLDRDGEGVSWHEEPTVDRTRPMGTLRADRAPATQLELPGDALERVRLRALVALAAEAVGAAAVALDRAVAHARSRHQFGRPIGAFQAVGHQLADAFMALETARSLVYWAGWAVAEEAPEAPLAAAAAKARSGEAAAFACERAIQVHGGIGFTWEHPLHRYYKRALAAGAIFGTAAEHRSAIARSLLG